MSLRSKMESILDHFHKANFKVVSDSDVKGERVVILQRYAIITTLVMNKEEISFDCYADIKEGVYEFGDLNILSRTMLNVKKIAGEIGLRERNTTERLYPDDRRGKNTETSGL